MGRSYDAAWNDASWNANFARLRGLAAPQIEEMLGRRISASDLQSCCCEVSKMYRAQEESRRAEEEGRSPEAINPFRPRGEAAARSPSKARPAPAPIEMSVPIEPPAPTSHALSARTTCG
jgi:hypothetical protein